MSIPRTFNTRVERDEAAWFTQPHAGFSVGVDTGMFVLTCMLMSVSLTGLPLHEWLGIALCPLVLLHVNWHARWYLDQFRRLLTPCAYRARINFFLNISLLVLMAGLVVSGLFRSHRLSAIVGEGIGRPGVWRNVHDWSSVAVISLVSLHLGLNWDWIMAAIRRHPRETSPPAKAPVSNVAPSARPNSVFANLFGKIVAITGITVLAAPHPVAAQDGFADDAAIKIFLHDRFDGKNVGMVIGLVDDSGSRVFGAGQPDNGTDQEMNGDTVFEIGSITKTFTTLLLEDMVQRGQMKLDDPVSKYLPASVKMPSRNGKEIALIDLATHTSGLPLDAQKVVSQNRNNPYDYTTEQLYAFLSNYTLARDPGARFEYSNLGMGLLGHAITLKAGKDYESLVRERICRPLRMNDTYATLTPKMKARLAAGHDGFGKRAANINFQFQAMSGCGALHSTANDLLKYVSAQIGLIPSGLTPLMQITQQIRHRDSPRYGNTGMAWMDRGENYPSNMELLVHGGGTAGYNTFIGFDKKQRRGVVVLCNQLGGVPAETIGWLLLEGMRLTREITAGLSPGKNGEMVGVGIKLGFDHESRALRITGVVPNSPAFQANLLAGLIVQKIDGIPTSGKGDQVCASLIRGEAGTKVRLELVNPGRNETNTVKLIRRKFMAPKQ